MQVVVEDPNTKYQYPSRKKQVEEEDGRRKGIALPQLQHLCISLLMVRRVLEFYLCPFLLVVGCEYEKHKV